MQTRPSVKHAVDDFIRAKTSRAKLTFVEHLVELSPDGWWRHMRTYGPSFNQKMLQLAYPSAIKDFTPRSPDILLWERALAYAFFLGSNRSAEEETREGVDFEFEWSQLRLMVANVLHDVMKTRHKLHVFAPARGDLRFFISRIGDFVAMEGEMRADVELMNQVANFQMHELNMLFWAAEPSHKPGTLHRMTPANYFAIYYNIESHRNRIADLIPLTPLFQDEPTDTVVTCCLNLLRKGSYDDEEAQATLFVASRLAALFPSEFVQAKVHREFMITLWTRFRFSTNNMLGWRLSAASMAFFTVYIHSAQEPNVPPDFSLSNRWTKAWVEMVLQQDLIPLAARMTYILVTSKNDGENHINPTEVQTLLGQLQLWLSSLSALCRAFPPGTFADKCLKPTWLQHIDAFRDLTLTGDIEKRAVAYWEAMGTRLGYNEKEMRRQHTESHTLGHILGCSWQRCILHKQIPRIKRPMFQDANQCKKVQYCSVECQRRDWTDGKHSEVCQPYITRRLNVKGRQAAILPSINKTRGFE